MSKFVESDRPHLAWPVFFLAAMKRMAALILLAWLPVAAGAQTPANPVIEGYGAIYRMEGVTLPDSTLDYRIVIDLKSSNSPPGQPNKGLVSVARLLNLFGAAGLDTGRVKVVVAIHYLATPVVLNQAGYRQKYGIDNPNLELLDRLHRAGVEVYVCGQSLVARQYDTGQVIPQVAIALSMLTVVAEYTSRGYTLLIVD